jgi:hypothetical protein
MPSLALVLPIDMESVRGIIEFFEYARDLWVGIRQHLCAEFLEVLSRGVFLETSDAFAVGLHELIIVESAVVVLVFGVQGLAVCS